MDIFFVRQAVYDRSKKIKAFELKFYDNKEQDKNKYEESKMQLLCSCGTVGINHFTNNKKAFVGFSEIAVLEDIPSLLGNKSIVIDLKQDFIVNKETINALRELKEDEYVISLRDLDNIELIKQFEDIIDIYVMDFQKNSRDQMVQLKDQIKSINKKASFMAINISSEEEFDFVYSDSGYCYFEGNYFSGYEKIVNNDLAARNISRFNIILELLKDNYDIDKIEYIIKSDVGITYKLMRFLNSATFSFLQKITSIRQAIMLLGKQELRKWLTLIVISEMQVDTNEELSNNTIIRGRLCELIAEKVSRNKRNQAFILGLFSNLERFLGKDIEGVMDEIPVDDDIKSALLGKQNDLYNILQLVKTYEVMDSEEMDYYTEKLGLNKKELLQMYLDSIDWLNQLTISLK